MTSTHDGSRNADGQVTATAHSHVNNCTDLSTTHPFVEPFAYDLAGRLITGDTTGGINYAYDAAGNLTKYSNRAPNYLTTYTQTFDTAGEITKQSGITVTTYTYETMGDRTSAVSTSSTTTYTYNQAGDMISAGPTGSRSTYLYDGDGNEAAYRSQGASTASQLIWSNAGRSMTLLYSDGRDYFVYGPGTTPVEQQNVSTSPYSNPTFLNSGGNDGRSTTFVTSASGGVHNPETYGPYGQATYGLGDGSVFGFAGQYTDSAGTSPSGLVNMRARWYDPETGTFMTPDPLVAETDEPYIYATDDPVNETDPTGMTTHGYCAIYGFGFATGAMNRSGTEMQCVVEDSERQLAYVTAGWVGGTSASHQSVGGSLFNFLKAWVASGSVSASVGIADFNTSAGTVQDLKAKAWDVGTWTVSIGARGAVGIGWSEITISATCSNSGGSNESHKYSGLIYGPSVGIGIGPPVTLGKGGAISKYVTVSNPITGTEAGAWKALLYTADEVFSKFATPKLGQ